MFLFYFFSIFEPHNICISSDSCEIVFRRCAVIISFFQIIGIGKQIKLQFYGDRSFASVGRHCILPFNPNVDVTKHIHKKCYVKAMQEALIESIHSMEQSKRAVDRLIEESCMQKMKSNNAVKVKCVADPVTHNKIASRSKQILDRTENSSIRSCVTRSKIANTQSANTESMSIHGPVMRCKKQTNTNTTRNNKKIKNSVRRSERLRKKNIT